jgi:hypothetical protein
MGLSRWAHARDCNVYEEAYWTSLGLWPVPFESRHVETPQGQDTQPVEYLDLTGYTPLYLAVGKNPMH